MNGNSLASLRRKKACFVFTSLSFGDDFFGLNLSLDLNLWDGLGFRPVAFLKDVVHGLLPFVDGVGDLLK